MKAKSILIVLYGVLLTSFCSRSQEFSEWRGIGRTGVYKETGLLKQWPANGPQLLWSAKGLPKGFSSMSVANNLVYFTGLKDTIDFLVAIDFKGQKKWETPIGGSWVQSFPDSRCTPTVEGNRVYVSSGVGDIACVDGISGKIIWSVKASEIYKGTYGEWGIAESLLIDGQKLYFTPGGPETMTIALDKATGKLIWKSPSINDKPAYVSPILIDYAGKKMIINVAINNIYAVDASTGAILWKIKHEETVDVSEFTARWPGMDFIKCVTPLYHDGKIYVTGGYQTGGVMLGMNNAGDKVNVIWTDKVLDVHHGGVVAVNGYIYGSNWLSNDNGDWCCIEWNTGKKMYEEHWKCKGSIISAEGMLYILDERNGNVGLVRSNPEKFDLISSFHVKEGSGPYWSHPIIKNGILYIRHGDAIMAYNIKE